MSAGRESEMVVEEYDVAQGVRRYRAYLLTESELSMLTWLPFWSRRRLIARLKAETAFDDTAKATAND